MFYKGRPTDKPNDVGTLVITDFSKAFDCVDHTFAIQKLCDLSVRSEIIPWIADFLASRRQRVQYRSALSEWRSSPVVFLRAISFAPSFSLLSSTMLLKIPSLTASSMSTT